MAHAKLSPSARHRWSACPGSVRATADLPEAPSGSSAIDGTHTHTLLAYCVSNKYAPTIGQVLTDHEGTFEVDKDRADRVQFALDYISERAGEQPYSVYSEVPLDLKALTGRDDLGGTADVVLVTQHGLEIIDLKDGFKKVSASGNLQLEQYALGIIGMGRWEHGPLRLTIIQRGTVDYVDTTVEALLETVPALVDQAAATDALNAPFVAGPHCMYCQNSTCSERVVGALAKADISFGPIVEVAQQAADIDSNSLDDDKLRTIIESAPMIRQMLVSAEEAALARFKEGKPIAGLKLVRGRGSRSWAFESDEMAVKLTRMGIPKGAVWTTKIVSPAQVSKITWTKRDGTVRQLTPRQIAMLDKEYIVKSQGALTVVPEADPRVAEATVAVATLFSSTEAPAIPAWLL
jgi:hypothetical protein